MNELWYNITVNPCDLIIILLLSWPFVVAKMFLYIIKT